MAVITNATELKDIESDMSGNYELGNNIDLNGETFEPIGHGPGGAGTPFEGTFDGRGYKIHNGSISQSSDSFIGLFAELKGATVTRLGLDISVRGNNIVGALAGLAYSGSVVEKCYSLGNVVAVGYSAGGLLGAFWDVNIDRCFATGNVSGVYQVGGLISYADDGTITNCFALGDINGGGDVEVGGLIGTLHTTGTPTSIVDCYSVGNISNVGAFDVGGLIGLKHASVTVTRCFYDTETSGQSDNDGRGVPKTTAEMKNKNTFLGWDIVAQSVIKIGSDGWNSNYDWGIGEANDGYPFLWLGKAFDIWAQKSNISRSISDIWAQKSNTSRSVIGVWANKSGVWKQI